MAQIDYFKISQDVLKQVNIVEIVSHYIQLQKRGRNYVALCPFHDDKSLGNFYVSEEKQIFKCFACNKAGNAINFVEYRENISFREALFRVCEISNIVVPELAEQKRAQKVDPVKEETYKCLKDINNFYVVSLRQSENSAEALEYLKARGLTNDIIDRFNIGLAQKNGENIVKYLTAKNYSLKTINNAGIINLESQPIRDTNAGRITFGITDRNNNIVGFSARIFGDNHSDSKYINTRETICFTKSKILYNYYYALQEARKVGYVYVLEGFMDVIAAYRVGIYSAVALMGTALTKEQIQLLRYMKTEVRLCLDLDGPGQSNMERIIKLFDENQIKYQLVNNDVSFKEKDSDEILTNHGADALRNFLENLISKGEWLINYYSKAFKLNTLEGRKSLLKKMLPIVASIKDKLDYEDFVLRLSTICKFTRETIDEYIKKYKAALQKSKKEEGIGLDNWYESIRVKDKLLSRLQLAEKQIVSYVMSSKEAYVLYQEKLDYLTDETYKEIVDFIEDYKDSQNYNGGDFSPKILIDYISSQKDNSSRDKKLDSIINVITDIYVSCAEQFPPFNVDTFNEVVKTIHLERERERSKQAYEQGKKGKTAEEQAQQALALINKRRNMVK